MQKKYAPLSLLLMSMLSSTALFANDLPPSTQGKEATGLVNPSSRFEVSNGWNLFLNTEFLWWIAKADGFFYAQNGYTGTTSTPVPPMGTKIFDGHIAKVHPDFRPGFRVAFGGNMEYDEWDILTSWTWFRSTARGSKSGNLLTLWGYPEIMGQPNVAQEATSASGKWKLGLNIFDVEMGRAFWVGRHFSLHPFVGVRGAWIDQDFHIKYTLNSSPVTRSRIKAQCDFSGGGIRAGTDMRFTLFGGWSIYGNASGSLLYGFYDCDFSQKLDSDKLADASDGFRQAASNAQLALGARWDTYVYKDRYHIGLYAQWEQNIWFGQNKMNHFFGDLSEGNLEQMTGDLTLSGGTFGFRFDF